MNKPENPQAFPCQDSRDNPNHPGIRDVYACSGMTLRDYFAGKIIAAFVGGWMADGSSLPAENQRELAAASYALADVMLAERAKTQ